MSVHPKLLKLYQSELGRRQLMIWLWSANWFDSLKYTLLRSQGFLYRKLSHVLLYIFEAFGIALLAEPAIAKQAAALTLASLLLSIFIDATLQASRFFLLRRRQTSVAILLIAPTIGLVAIYVLAYQWLVPRGGFTSVVLLLGICRIVSTLVDLVVEVLTFRLSISRRIYLAPVSNVIAIASSICIITVFNAIGGLSSLMGIIAGHAVIRVAWAVVYALAASNASKQNLMKERRQPQRAVTKTKASHQEYALVVSRALLVLGHWFQPFLLSFSFTSPLMLLGIGGAWGVQSFLSSLVERPYRAIMVDLVHATERRQWSFLATQVRLASITSLMISLACVSACMFFSLALVDKSFWPVLILLSVTLLNKSFYARFFLVEADALVSPPFLAVRWIVSPLLFWFLKANPWQLCMAFIALELGLLAFNIWRYRTTDLRTYLEFRSGDTDFGRESVEVTPKNFLTCFSIISPVLTRFEAQQGLFVVKLRSPFKSFKRMHQFILQVSSCVRKTDLAMAIDARTLLVWCPGASTIHPISMRLHVKFPMIIDAISSVDRDGLFKIAAIEGGKSFGMKGYEREALSLATFLELSLREHLGGEVAGSWWVLNKKGAWISTAGEANALESEILHSFLRRSVDSVFWFDGRLKRHPRSTKAYWLLQPYGELIAIYAGDHLSSRTLLCLLKLARLLVSEHMQEFSARETIAPTEFFMIERILKKLQDRFNFDISKTKLAVGNALREGGDQLIARTEDGISGAWCLSIKARVAPAQAAATNPVQIQPSEGYKNVA